MTTTAPRRPPLALLVAVTAIGPLALNIFLPSMPGLQRAFATDYGSAQLTLSLYFAGIAVAQLFYGPLSDRFGRRPVLLAGLALFLAGSLICLLAPSITVLIGGRVVQAVGGCAGMVLSRAIIRDLYERDQAASVLAYVTMAMVVAPMLAPTIGGFLDIWFGWRASFVFVFAFGALVLAAAVALLAETHRPQGAGRAGRILAFGSFLLLLRQRAFCGYAFQVAFTSAVFFSFLGGAPYVMVELLQRPPSEFGLYFVAVSFAYMAGNFAAGRYSNRFGSDRMIRFGTTIALAGTAGFAAVVAAGGLSPATLFGTVAVVALGNGLSIPNGLAGAVSVDPRIVGAASGLSGFLQMAVGASASYLVGQMLADSAAPLAAIMLAGAAGAAVCHAALASPPPVAEKRSGDAAGPG